MTGYGKSVAEFQGKKIHAEIKSLNSKALDITSRIAPLYREKEMEIRQFIQTELERGKVEFSLWIEKGETADAAPINAALVKEYYQQMIAISQDLGLDTLSGTMDGRNSASDWMRILTRMPDVTMRTEVEVLSDEEWLVARRVVEEAVQHLVDFRKQEGQALAKKFQEKIDNITALLAGIEPYEQGRTEKIRQRIIDTLEQQIGTDYDKNRLEQELIYYIEKLDISEEKQRLTNHLHYFIETMTTGHGQGKKLGFIAQEMGREINTTGSKANQAEMQNIVVQMKDELEQIKEQVLNVM